MKYKIDRIVIPINRVIDCRFNRVPRPKYLLIRFWGDSGTTKLDHSDHNYLLYFLAEISVHKSRKASGKWYKKNVILQKGVGLVNRTDLSKEF